MEKNRNFHHVDCEILTFKVTKIVFLTLRKPGSSTSQGHLCMKKCKNGGASLDSFFKASWPHA